MKTFKDLLKSEIKKAERFASKRDGKDVRVSGWYTDNKMDELGFISVHCEMCSDEYGTREHDIVLNVFMPDRRRSFVAEALSALHGTYIG